MSVPAPEVSDEVQPASWLLVPVLTIGVTVSILGARALGVFLPVVAEDLDTSVSVVGQVPSLMLLLAGVFALIAGPLADRYGFRLMLVAGLLSVCVSSVATGLSFTFPILLIVTLVGAVARAAVLPTAQAVVLTTFADEDARRQGIGWVTTGLSTAAIVGIPILTTIAGLTSWRVSFFVMGAMALVAAVLLQRTLADDARRAAGRFRFRDLIDSYEPIRRHRPTTLLMASSLLAEIGLWGAMTYFSALLVQRHGLSIDAVGWAFLGIGVIAFAANIVAQGRAGKRPRPLMIGSRLWCALCLGVAFGLPVSPLVSLGFVLLVAPALSTENLATTLVLNATSPAGRATTLTLRSAAVCIGTAVGGALGGGVLAIGGYEALGALSFVVLLVSAAVAWWSRAGAPDSARAAA